jgi:molybdopterin biosynthesis enzyme MoaB
MLTNAGFTVVDRAVIADGQDEVAQTLLRLSENFAGLILTTGGNRFLSH